MSAQLHNQLETSWGIKSSPKLAQGLAFYKQGEDKNGRAIVRGDTEKRNGADEVSAWKSLSWHLFFVETSNACVNG